MVGLVACGLLTAGAILVCVLYNETVGFNLLMCVFCALAIASLWSKEPEEKEAEEQNQEKEEQEQGHSKQE